MSTDDPQGPEHDDGGADTQMFRAFVEREESHAPPANSQTFRVVTLLLGLLAFVAIVWLLLR